MDLSQIEFSIISQNLLAVPREMGAKLIQSAFSTIVREARDCSAALLDSQGQVIAQVDQNPILLGSMSATFRWVLEHIPLAEITAEDFLITNDPYSGGQHLQDVFIFFPIFSEGEIVGFTASVAHHLDIGGGSAGISSVATDVYGEGFRIPPTRLNYARDWVGGSFRGIVAANVRIPALTLGDFDAQFAANAIGRARFLALIDRYGIATIRETSARMLDYTERMLRAAISEIPDGIYTGEEFIDEGDDGEPVPIRTTLTVTGESIVVDFTGTGGQVSGNLNSPYASTVAAVLCAIKGLLTGSHVPFNQGGERPVSIRAPLGSIVNPRAPAAVRARLEVCYRAYDAILLALAPVVPHRVAAVGYDTLTVGSMSKLSENGYSVYLEVFGGGNGATRDRDGCSAVDCPLSNCTNTPVESADRGYSFFRTVKYELITDSCGHGRTRGGLGFVKEYEILEDDVRLAFYGDRFKLPARGIFEGGTAMKGGCFLERNGVRTKLHPKSVHSLKAGDRVSFRLGGGGGFGPAKDRDRALVEADLEAGLISAEAATRIYGYAIE